MTRFGIRFAAAGLACALTGARPAPPPPPPPYATLARLVVDNPVIVRGEIRRQSVIKTPKGQTPPPAGQVRLLLRARITGVLTAPAAIPEEINILWQGPVDAKGKPPRFDKGSRMLFLSPAADRDDLFTLRTGDAPLAGGPALDSAVKAIARDARSEAWRDLKLDGVTEVFSQPDEPPYVRQTQVFIATRSGHPVSVVMRAHGDDPQKDVVLLSTSDFVGQAEAVRPETLGWYFLACTLERKLPAEVLAGQPSEADATFQEADFERLFARLGPCQ